MNMQWMCCSYMVNLWSKLYVDIFLSHNMTRQVPPATCVLVLHVTTSLSLIPINNGLNYCLWHFHFPAILIERYSSLQGLVLLSPFKCPKKCLAVVLSVLSDGNRHLFVLVHRNPITLKQIFPFQWLKREFGLLSCMSVLFTLYFLFYSLFF